MCILSAHCAYICSTQTDNVMANIPNSNQTTILGGILSNVGVETYEDVASFEYEDKDFYLYVVIDFNDSSNNIFQFYISGERVTLNEEGENEIYTRLYEINENAKNTTENDPTDTEQEDIKEDNHHRIINRN